MSTRGPISAFKLCPGLVQRVEQQLAERIGLDVQVVGRDAVSCAVRRRMIALSLTAEVEYEHQLQSESEWAEMIEAVLVSETWFFREPAAFSALVSRVLCQWAPANPIRPLRLLSIPCSSGEEPFSMVMALLDEGFPSHRLQVDAIDLSATALALAQRGVYGTNSFRSAELSFRARYFRPVEGGFLLNKTVRNRVRFVRGNFLDPGFAAVFGPYDFIFCRNLLIYLHQNARQQVLSRVRTLLAPGGALFVGLAEQLLTYEHGLKPATTMPTSPSFKSRANHSAEVLVCNKHQASDWPAGKESESRPASLRGGMWAVEGRRDTRRPGPARADCLEEARHLADAGRLREAAMLCEAQLRENRSSAAAYYLLGLVREAAGEPGAVHYYRKALYLEPNHRDALLQMALLARKEGDLAGAHLFRVRAGRCPPSTIQS